jgi:hypothetical protein
MVIGKKSGFCHNGRHRLALGDARTLSNANHLVSDGGGQIVDDVVLYEFNTV